MELVDVVRKLVGPIEPVGETHTDEQRYKNLEAMTGLIGSLLGDVDRVIPCKNRHEASMKKAGEYASAFFNDLGISE